MMTRPILTYAAVCVPSHEKQVANQIEARDNAGNRRVVLGNTKSVTQDVGDNGSPPSPKSSGGPIQLMAFHTDPMPPTHSTDHDPTKNSLRVSLDKTSPLPITNTPDPNLLSGGGGGGGGGGWEGGGGEGGHQALQSLLGSITDSHVNVLHFSEPSKNDAITKCDESNVDQNSVIPSGPSIVPLRNGMDPSILSNNSGLQTEPFF